MKKTLLSSFVIAMGLGVVACGGNELVQGDELAMPEQTLRSEATTHQTSLSPTPDTNSQQTPTLHENETSLISECPAGNFCAWRDSDYRGKHVPFSSGGCHNYGGPQNFNDQASSWYNRTSRDVCLYWDTNCKGTHHRSKPGDRADSMGSWNDEVSSVKIGC